MIVSRRCAKPGRFTATIMAVFIVVSSTPLVMAASSISGRVLGPAGVTPVPDARVVFYNLVTGNTTQSEPTDVTGDYAVSGLESGRYDVAVRTSRGLWMVARAVELGGSDLRSMSFALRESTYWEGTTGQTPRTSPLGDDIVGTAVVLEDEKAAPDRWPTEKKRKVLLGATVGAGVLALALAAGGDDDASPFTP